MSEVPEVFKIQWEVQRRDQQEELNYSILDDPGTARDSLSGVVRYRTGVGTDRTGEGVTSSGLHGPVDSISKPRH